MTGKPKRDPRERIVPERAVRRLQLGDRTGAIRAWLTHYAFIGKPIKAKLARNMMDSHIRRNLREYPPRVWPDDALEKTTPPPWCCKSHRMRLMRKVRGKNFLPRCWGRAEVHVHGHEICLDCADELKKLED